MRKTIPMLARVTAVSTRHKPPSCHSHMARAVRLHAWLCLLCGCFFIRGLFNVDARAVPKVVWKSWYTLYSFICLAFFLWVDISAFIAKAEMLDGYGNQLNSVLRAIIHIVLFVRMVSTLHSMTAGSSKLVAFYTRAAAFERQIRVKRGGFCSNSWFLWTDFRHTVYCVLYCLGCLMTLLNPPPYQPFKRREFSATTEAYFWSKLFVLRFFYFVLDSICTHVLRRACQILSEYIENELLALRACLDLMKAQINDTADISKRIEEVRRNLCSVRQLKEEINRIWVWSLIITTASVITILCWSIYDIAYLRSRIEKHFSIVFYAGSATYEFIALASASQSLTNKTKKIKDMCKAARNTDDPCLRRNVKLLHDWIDPEDMALRGGDFFSVNMSLLAQMAASVLTYSVILVQTDQSVEGILKETSRGFFSSVS